MSTLLDAATIALQKQPALGIQLVQSVLSVCIAQDNALAIVHVLSNVTPPDAARLLQRVFAALPQCAAMSVGALLSNGCVVRLSQVLSNVVDEALRRAMLLAVRTNATCLVPLFAAAPDSAQAAVHLLSLAFSNTSQHDTVQLYRDNFGDSKIDNQRNRIVIFFFFFRYIVSFSLFS